MWGPSGEASYPLAAFFFEGDEMNDGFSLCFERRDGIEGLHRYFDKRAARTAKRQRLSLTVRLSPIDMESLFSANPAGASIRDSFHLKIFNESALYRLESLKSYNPATNSAECTFIRL